MAASAQFDSIQQFLRDLGARGSQLYASLPRERIRQLLVLLLLLCLLIGMVKAVWALFPGEEAPLPSGGGPVLGEVRSATAASTANAVQIDPAVVKGWQLFGAVASPTAQPVVPVSDLSDAESQAKETRLQLTLNGIIESDTEKNSRAVITYQGKQDQYALGDKLPVRGRVTLRRLLDDRVLLDNSGKVEALYLFDKRKAELVARQAPKPATRPAASSSQRRSSLGSSMRQRLMENPMSITDVVRISEARENGQLIGYKVRPSKDREQFEKLGLKTNDVVLAVNGVALDNVSNAMRVFQTLRTETEAAFDISRSGENISLVVSLDDVLAEDEQE